MMYSKKIGNEVYVYRNEILIYKKWLKQNNSVVFNNPPNWKHDKTMTIKEQAELLGINVVSKFDMQKFKEYVQTYDAKKNGLDNDDTIVKDMLYGIGLCLNKKEFEFADGFKKFKTFIKAFL